MTIKGHKEAVAEEALEEARIKAKRAVVEINAGRKKLSDIKNEAVLETILNEHFLKLNEDCQFSSLYLGRDFISASIRGFMDRIGNAADENKSVLDIYKTKNLLRVLRHPESMVQWAFINAICYSPLSHKEWDKFSGVDLARFLTHSQEIVRLVVSQIISLEFLDEAIIKRGLADESGTVREVWVKRNAEFENAKLSTKHDIQRPRVLDAL